MIVILEMAWKGSPYRIVVHRQQQDLCIERRDIDAAGDPTWRPHGQHSSDIDADTLVACALLKLAAQTEEVTVKDGKTSIDLGAFE